MNIKIKRVDTTLPIPQYHTNGSAGFDFYARETTAIPAGGLARIPSNLIIATPNGHLLMVVARSSLAAKKGLMMPNGVGVVDSDFTGDNDEILISMYNFTNRETIVERGERFAQGLFIKVEQAEWKETETMGQPNRGGFGTTGQ